MKEEIYHFKNFAAVLNFFFCFFFIAIGIYLIPDAISHILNLKKSSDLWISLFSLLSLWIGVFEFGYTSLLFLPKGVALELHDDHIMVCSASGLKMIPKKYVKGCKKTIHRLYGGPKAGLVEISVAKEFRVLGPYGNRVNPRFYGASILGETEQSIVKKIREWRKGN